MRFHQLIFLFSVLSIAISSCSSPDSFGKVNLKIWRDDRGGCKGDRTAMKQAITDVKKELLGKSSNEIGRMFGAPDIHQLGGRNQKIYIYFIEKGPHCDDKKNATEVERVIFRFNAVSLLTEVNFLREMPE